MSESLVEEIVKDGESEPTARPTAEPVNESATKTVIKPAAVKKEPLPVEKRDRILALSMFVFAYLASEVFGLFTDPGYYGYGVTVLGIGYAVMIFLYVRRSNTVFPKEVFFWLAVLVIGACSYSFVYQQSLKEFHSLFLRLVALYLVLTISGVLLTGRTSGFFLFDGINMLFVIPFNNFVVQLEIARREIFKLRFFSTLFKALLGILVALPLLFIVAALLGSADDQFAELLELLIDKLGNRFFQTVWAFIASLPVGCYLFGLIYGSAHKRGMEHIKKDALDRSFKACAIIPSVSFYAVLLIICTLYVLFINLQGSYYFSAIRGILPEGFTYSEYARQGFFELLAVSLINIGVIGVSQLFARGKGLIMKGFHILLSVLTLLLILTAMAKMGLYIEAHGLTPLRVIPSIFMIFLTLVFVLVIINQVKRVPIARISIYAFAAGYILLSAANMDALIAEYNLNRYQNGTLAELSSQALRNGGIASVASIYRVWSQTQDEQLKSELEDIAIEIQDREYRVLYHSDIKYDNLIKARARASISAMTE